MNAGLAAYVSARLAEFARIPAERRAHLDRLAAHVAGTRAAGRPCRLVFVCTHNSRRSQMAQIWARVAADSLGLGEVETDSGGTEATAFAPQAADALRRAGFDVEPIGDGRNPVHQIRWRDDAPPFPVFSKVFDRSPDPASDFCAVMTCARADAACPVVPGAALRISLPYDDPEASDGTAREAATYDVLCRRIAREMLYLFARTAPEGAGGRHGLDSILD